MADLLFLDSAFPLSAYPAADGLAFYIGGDTPHIWAVPEIDACPYRFRLPIFVHSNPPGPGAAADVASAVTRLQEIACPKGSLVAWDMETAADAAYIMAVYNGLKAAGYQLIVYGSQSSVLGNQAPDGLYWGADWTGVPQLLPQDGMTQYVNLGPYDESLARPALPFWDTKPATPPPAPAPWTLTWVAVPGAQLPVLWLGAADTAMPHWYVRRVQSWLKDIYGLYAGPLDGDYGPRTKAAVTALQNQHGLAPGDGIVGPKTWRLLITASAS